MKQHSATQNNQATRSSSLNASVAGGPLANIGHDGLVAADTAIGVRNGWSSSGQPSQGIVGHLAPAGVEDQRVTAIWEYVIVGDCTGTGVVLVRLACDDLGNLVIFAASGDEQRSAIARRSVHRCR